MKKLHLTHKIFTTSVVGAVTVTTSVAAVFAYQAVTQYKPSSSKEDMKNNQVLFNNNKNSLGNGNKNEQNSKWLEKQDQKNKQDATQNSNYLFDKNQDVAVQKTMTVNTQTTTSTDENTNQNTKNDNANTVTDSDINTVVDVDKNAKNPDIIIDDNNGTSGKDNTGKEDNGSGTIDPALPDSNHKPAPSPGDNTNPGGNTSNNKYDKVKDPTLSKDELNQQIFGKLGTEIKDYSKNEVEEIKKDSNFKMSVLIQPMDSLEYKLYQGSTITQSSIFNMMVTGVYFSSDDNEVYYSWDESALDKYVKINGISVDGGKTWIHDFPYKIENGVTGIKLDMSYRFSENDSWMHYDFSNDTVDNMPVGESKVMVLKNKLNKDADQIDVKDIVNSMNMYPNIGDTLDLYDSQFYILSVTNKGVVNEKDKTLNYLFPGWTENEEPLDWEYTVTAGRHIIEPMDLIPLDSQYTAKLKYAYIDVVGQLEYDGLQTLVGTSEVGKLVVPEYIQMIDFESKQSFDSVKLPETVRVVSDENISVKDKWIVSKDNPYLTTKDGLLMSKDLTELISVPASVKELKIGKDVTKVSAKNLNGTTIYLEADSLDALPDIGYSYYIDGKFKNLNNCKIVLKDSLFDEYILANYDSIVGCENVSFAKASNPDVEYTVKDHCIYSENTLYKAISGVTTIHLEDEIDTIGKNAFKNVEGIRNLFLSDTMIQLEEGCFDKSSIQHIYCLTQEQVDYLKKRLKELGYDDIEVTLNETDVSGFKYKIDENGTITLLKAPSNVTEFNGVVNNVQFDVIGDGAFKDCASLEMVYLPENIKEIGEEAFEDCSNLEMMLIDSRDSITIGDNAFEGLSNIRILACNAQQAIMNGYSPDVYNKFGQNMFFVKSYGYGYENAMQFLGSYGVFTLESIGKNAQAVYLTQTDGTPFLMMASSEVVDKEVVLPSTTTEFYPYAMAETCSGSALDPYTINLGDLQSVYYNGHSFYNANISGDITIGKDCYIDNYAFEWCQFIDSVTALDYDSLMSSSFSNCDNIKKITLKNTDDLYDSAFSWCVGVQEIEFVGKIPNITGMPVSGSNSIHITLTNTEYTKEKFLQKYMYMFAGYTDSEDETASQAMWEAAKWEIIYSDEHMWDEELYNPTYDEIYEQFKAKLLLAENNLRKMLDMDQVTEPTWMPTDIPTKEEYEGKTEDEEKKDEEGSEEKDPTTETPDESEDTKDDADQSDSTETDVSKDPVDGDSTIEIPSADETENGVEQPSNEENMDLNESLNNEPSVQTEEIQLQDEEDFQ